MVGSARSSRREMTFTAIKLPAAATRICVAAAYFIDGQLNHTPSGGLLYIPLISRGRRCMRSTK